MCVLMCLVSGVCLVCVQTLNRVSPSSLKLTLEGLQRAEGKDLKACLEMVSQ
jgi:hypothetical protein